MKIALASLTFAVLALAVADAIPPFPDTTTWSINDVKAHLTYLLGNPPPSFQVVAERSAKPSKIIEMADLQLYNDDIPENWGRYSSTQLQTIYVQSRNIATSGTQLFEMDDWNFIFANEDIQA